MRLRTLLETEALGLRLLGGEEGLDRAVTGVMTTDLRDPSRYLDGGELVLTGLAWLRAPDDSERFVALLARAGVAGLAAGEAEWGRVPEDLVAACARHGLPLLAVSEEVAFATITEHVSRHTTGERAGDLAAVVARHRRLLGVGEGGLEPLLDLLATELDLRAWVLSPLGRVLAGGELPEPRGVSLAGEHLASLREPSRVTGQPRVVRVDGLPHTLLPVPDREGLTPGQRLERGGWSLAVRGDVADWSLTHRTLLSDVTALVEAERERGGAHRAVGREMASEVVRLLRSAAPGSEVEARLRLASPVLRPAPRAVTGWRVVVARLAGLGAPERGPEPLAAGALLEEALTLTGTPSAVTVDGEEAVALVAPPESAGSAAVGSTALRTALAAPLERGLSGARLSVGVSGVVTSGEALRGAWAEARHARGVAAAGGGTVAVASHRELASHVLLLPFVPEEVRQVFSSRLLEPLAEYDRQHRSGLVETLETFLDCDGSWSRCARRLHLHVNTLRYRISRVERLTGRDLSRLEDRVDFFLALRLR
ncbi:PucR family transcriptional regulator ligand-binding domain-containing protein [Streptomyces sp. NPDC005438]|uniref:PucR family transcriptional regulator n=1 Tax=Streptomyces sp. NPDC005438 TaxID=3156880 RepID=UPI0033B01FB1